LFHTTNGGSTWVEIASPFHDPYDVYTGIASVPSGGIWLCGPHGVVSHFGVASTSTTSVCSGDGSGTVCPCGNNGVAGAGCANSVFTAGASLSSSGYASASTGGDSLVLTAANLSGPGLFFQGTSLFVGGNGVVFGDGLLCAGGAMTRLSVVFPAGGSASYPNGSTPTAIHVAGAPIVPGDVRHYQCWYRDAASFCTASTFNLTQALTVTWGP
jgi:hypothetical protein